MRAKPINEGAINVPAGLLLHQIRPERARELCDHLDRVNEAIHRRGGWIDWQYPMDVGRVRGWCAAGEAWTLPYGAGGWAATAVLTPTDPLWDDNADALYLSKVAAAPGSGAGRRMLAAVHHHAARRGYDVLRLDCLRHNPNLREWYEAQGFTHRGDRSYDGRDGTVHVSLYERPVPRSNSYGP